MGRRSARRVGNLDYCTQLCGAGGLPWAQRALAGRRQADASVVGDSFAGRRSHFRGVCAHCASRRKRGGGSEALSAPHPAPWLSLLSLLSLPLTRPGTCPPLLAIHDTPPRPHRSFHSESHFSLFATTLLPERRAFSHLCLSFFAIFFFWYLATAFPP